MERIIGFDARLWNESGVGRYIRNLLWEFDKEKLPFTLKVFLNSDNFEKVKFSNPKIHKIHAPIKWHSIAEQLKFKKILDRENLDLVHFPYFSFPYFYNKPFVITIHDLIIDHYPTGIASSRAYPIYLAKNYGYKKLIARAVNKAEKIITPSIATKNELIDHYKASSRKIETVYEGFDRLIVSSDNKNLVSKNFILYVGNAYPHKNLERLISSYSLLKKEIEVDLVCIGRDDFFYRKLSQRHKEIHFLHNIDDSALFDYYTHARLIVTPSLMEGFGLPVLEAMSLSCPVACSDIPAFKEISNDAALYFDPIDSKDIAQKIKLILNDENLRRKLIQKGLTLSKKYSWEKCAEQTLKIYESCDSLRQG